MSASDTDRDGLALFLAAARQPGARGIVYVRDLDARETAGAEPAVARAHFARLERRGYLARKQDTVDEPNPRYRLPPPPLGLGNSVLWDLATAVDTNGQPKLLRGKGEPYWELTEEALELLQAASPENVPASDRFVSLNHNQPEVQEAQMALHELAEAVRGANGLFANPDDRLFVLSEVEALRASLGGARAHVASLWHATRESAPIAWLAKESASGVVKAAAERAFGAVLTLVRFLIGGG